MPKTGTPQQPERAQLVQAVTSPIGFFVLALLIVEGFLAIVLTSAPLAPADRMMCVYLGVGMFLLVGGIVTLLVWFKSKAFVFDKGAHLDEARIVQEQTRRTVVAQNAKSLAPLVETTVRNDLESVDLIKRIANASEQEIAALLRERASNIANDIKQASFLSVDFSDLDPGAGTKSYPLAAFRTMGNLLDELYFALEGKVRPFAYGTDWVLQDRATNQYIRSLRMLTGAPVGTPVPDDRTLADVGITAGTELRVVRPKQEAFVRSDA